VTGLLHGLAGLADGGTVLIDPSGHPQLAEAAAAAGVQIAVAPLTGLASAAAAVAEVRPLVTVLDRPALTGRHWTLPMIAGLAEATAQAGGVLVVDESCACYLPPGTSGVPLTSTVPGLVVLRGISKGYCCGGLRIGFAVASPDLAPAVRAVQPPLAASALSLSVALDLLRQPDPLARLRARIAEVKPIVQAAARSGGLPLIETSEHVPWLVLPADPPVRAALTYCGLVTKDVPVLPTTVPDGGAAAPGLLRMSLPLSAQRLDAVLAALSRVAGLVAP
jgi:histidinol-phosphate/aromatic aminotransferase/cobyric acid decarboxylase-like protein